jgi:hypothetical protein
MNDKKTVAPELDLVVTVGESYVLTDDRGQELGIEAKEHPWTIEFLTAFDEFMHLRNTSHHNDSWQRLALHWELMPVKIQNSLPSRMIHLRG